MKKYLTLQKKDVSTFIKTAQLLELSQDLEELAALFKQTDVLNDLEENPSVEEFPQQVQGEILRLVGFFLSNYGRAKRIAEMQERGKDLLFRAIEYFESVNQWDNAAESKCQIALCYWREGAVAEAETFLEDAESRFVDNKFHPAYLRIQVNRMIILYWSERMAEALKIIKNIKLQVDLSGNDYLRTMFHNQSGLVYTRLNDHDKTVFHLLETVRLSNIIGSKRLSAIALNNLAYCQLSFGDLPDAEDYVEESIGLFTELGDSGWLATVLDTKANIQLACGKTDAALETIKKSLEFLKHSGDALSTVESLWTLVQIYLAENRTSEAMACFAELVQTAKTQIGEFAVKQFAGKLAERIYIKKGSVSLFDELGNFKREQIQTALERTGKIKNAADLLGISHQSLSDTLKRNYPDLHAKYSPRIKRKTERRFVRVLKETKTERFQPIATDLIIPFQIPDAMRLTGLREDNLVLFYVPEAKARRLELSEDIVCAVRPDNFIIDKPFMVNFTKTNLTECGYLEKDNWSGVHYLLDEFGEPEPFSTDDILVIGEIVAFSPVSRITTTKIEFFQMQKIFNHRLND